MSTNNDPERDHRHPESPESERHEPAREEHAEPASEIIVAEPSSVEPGTLEPVVVRTGADPLEGGERPGWTAPAENHESAEPNPYVVRTTVPPMNPHTTGAPVGHHPEGAASAPAPAAPTASSGIPGGEIYSQAPTPVHVVHPAQPVRRGNRLFGTVVALLGTVAFAVVYAAVALIFFAVNPAVDNAVATLTRFLANFAFIVPVAFFAIAFILLVLILNRAGWWAYIIGGFVVAAVVYALGEFLRSLTMDPLPIAAAIVAREVSVWTGAVVSSRGRKVKERNTVAKADHEKILAEAPATVPQGSPAW
jgi:hypothetical protein